MKKSTTTAWNVMAAAVCAIAFSASVHGATWSYSKSGGTAADLQDPSCWTDSSSGHGIPQSGDTVNILPGASLVLEEAGIVGPQITFIVKANSGAYGALTVGDGTVVSNCAIQVGESGKSVSGDNYARLVLAGSGMIYSGNVSGSERQQLDVYPNGKVAQTGGVNKMYAASIKGWYQHDGGTNSITGGSMYVQVEYGEKTGYHLSNNARLFGAFGVESRHVLENITSSEVFNNSSMRFEVPNGNKGTGYLTVSNCNTVINNLWLTYKRNSATDTQAGYVDFFNSTIGLTKIDYEKDAEKLWGNTNSYARITLGNSFVWKSGGTLSGTQADARLGRTRADIVVTNGSCFSCNQYDPRVDYETYVAHPVASLTLGYAVNAYVDKTSAFYACGLYQSAGSEVTVDGGVLNTTYLSGSGGSSRLGRPIVFHARGGARIEAGDIVTQADDNKGMKKRFFLGAKGTGQSSADTIGDDYYFYLEDSCLTNAANNYCILRMGTADSQNTIHFEVSGKSNMRMTGYDWYAEVVPANPCIEMVFKGGLHNSAFKQIDASGKHFLLEFVADATPGRIAPVVLSRSAAESDLVGDLRIRLDGGVMLTDKDAFEVMKHEAKNFTSDFLSTPADVGSTLWSVEKKSRVASVKLAASLASFTEPAEMYVPETPVAMGSVAFDVGATNKIESIAFDLGVRAADGTTKLSADELSALADALADAGYVGSSAGDDTLHVAIPLELAAEHSTNRFVWDFTHSGGAKALGSVVTNATVTSVTLSMKRPAKGMAIIFR